METKQTVSKLDDEQMASVASLLRRVFMFLEDGDWENADEYCERVLDMEPENAQAWLGKLLAEMKAELKDCISAIQEKEKEQIYAAAVQKMNFADRPEEFVAAAQAFKSLGAYKDSAALAKESLEKARVCQKNVTYYSAKEKMSRKAYKEAAALFESISGWLDADEQASVCRMEAEKKAKRGRMRRVFAVAGFCVAAVFLVVYFKVIIPNSEYNHAVKRMEAEEYEEAAAEFLALDGYKDSEKQIENCYIEKYGREAYSKVKNIQPGDSYTFGEYRQNARETIEWVVLDKRGAALLLASRYLLDECEYYNLRGKATEWEDCLLRKSGKNIKQAAIVDDTGEIKNKDFYRVAYIRPAMWIFPTPE